MTRLQDQTTAYMQLQDELDNYEWYEEDEEDNTGTVKANECGEGGAIAKNNSLHPPRPQSSRSHHGAHSRPSSTRLVNNKIDLFVMGFIKIMWRIVLIVSLI